MTIPNAQIDILIQGYLDGLDTMEAAALAGIPRRTVDKWRTEQPETHPGLAQRIDEAIATHVAASIKTISSSRATDPRSAMWLLEHAPSTRARYAPRVETETDAAAATVMQLLAASMAARVQVADASTPPLLPAADG